MQFNLDLKSDSESESELNNAISNQFASTRRRLKGSADCKEMAVCKKDMEPRGPWQGTPCLT